MMMWCGSVSRVGERWKVLLSTQEQVCTRLGFNLQAFVYCKLRSTSCGALKKHECFCGPALVVESVTVAMVRAFKCALLVHGPSSRSVRRGTCSRARYRSPSCRSRR